MVSLCSVLLPTTALCSLDTAYYNHAHTLTSHTLKYTHVTHIYPHLHRQSNINCTRFSFQVANSFFGVGNQVFVGFGGAAFIRSYSYSARIVDYKYPTVFTYTVGGTGIRSSGTRGQNLVVTKGGVTRYIYNKTTHSVTQISSAHAQWTASPTSPGGGKFSRRKAVVQKKRVVQAAPGKRVAKSIQKKCDAAGKIS